MSNSRCCVTIYVATTVTVLFLCGPLCSEGRGDFTLWDDDQITVNVPHTLGTLYNQSQASLISGASVNSLYAYDDSTVDISGGSLYYPFLAVSGLSAYGTSTVNISGGSVTYLHAYDTNAVDISGGSVTGLWAYGTSNVDVSGGTVYTLWAYGTSNVDISGGTVDLSANDTSNVDISGGTIEYLWARDHSTVDISGGSMDQLKAYDTSTVTFIVRDFRLGAGLSLDGDRVLGTGFLSGEWYDGTRWTVNITENATGATILATPEPATLSLLALGGLAILRRRRKRG